MTITVSLYAGFLLALPVFLWQVWSFFAPAFDPSVERKMLGLVAFAVVHGSGRTRVRLLGACSRARSTG